MKTIKFMALCMALVLFVSLLAGCRSSEESGSGGNNTLTGTVTLKQFLDSGPKVGFVGANPLDMDKDSKATGMYLFEDGKIYDVCSFDGNGNVTDEYKLTWGEIAKMSDAELLAHARKYKVSPGEGSKSGFQMDTGEYTLHITRNPDHEWLCVKGTWYGAGEDHGTSGWKRLLVLGDDSSTEIVLDSTFYVFTNPLHPTRSLIFRTSNDLTITLDDSGTEGLENPPPLTYGWELS